MDPEHFVANILEAIRSGRDLWLYDQYIHGPDHIECACSVLIEKRDRCTDPQEAARLTAAIQKIEKVQACKPRE